MLNWIKISSLVFAIFTVHPIAAESPEWEAVGCGIVKKDLKLSPHRLFAEFVRRDGEGDFPQTSTWLNQAVACPDHMGGPDVVRRTYHHAAGER